MINLLFLVKHKIQCRVQILSEHVLDYMMYNINKSGKFAITQYRNSYKFQYHINNVINHALISKSPIY